MNIETWPFLISRNQYLDYRTITAPEFICNDSSANILSKSADAELIVGENIAYREIRNYRRGEMTLIYRVLKATKKDIGSDDSEEVLRDSQGREISLIEGVIVMGFPLDVKLPANFFETVHEQSIKAYQNFWKCSTPPSASPTKVLSVQKSSADKSLSLKEVTPYTAQGSLSLSVVQKQTWHCLHTELTIDSINSVVFHPKDPNFLAVRCKYQQVVQVWDLHDFKNLHACFKDKGPTISWGGSTTSVAFSPDGKLLATAMIEKADKNVIKIWDWKEDKLLQTFSGHSWSIQGRIFDLAFSSDSVFLASCSQDGNVKLWDTNSGGELKLKCPISRNGIPVYAIASSPTDDFLVTGDKEEGIKLWSFFSGQEMQEFKIQGHTAQVNSIKFSPNGKLLASGDKTGSLKIWSLKDGSELKHIEAHEKAVHSISFSPDGNTIASGSDDHDIKLWDVETGKLVTTLSGHTDSVNSVAFSSDGKMIVSGSGSKNERRDDGVKIWQLKLE
jgi:WD40 repeat protein